LEALFIFELLLTPVEPALVIYRVFMDLQVILQVLLQRKAFVANVALKTFCWVVDGLVTPHAVLVLIDLVTAGVDTGVNLLSLAIEDKLITQYYYFLHYSYNVFIIIMASLCY
jgi:hypothetical protein